MTPDETSNITITLKGEGKDASWVVIRGNSEQVARHIKELFAFPEEEVAGLDPIELVLNADSTFKALSTAKEVFKATVIPSPGETTPQEATGATQADSQRELDAWATVGEAGPRDGSQGREEPQHPYAHVLKVIEAATTLDALQKAWERERLGGYDGHIEGAFKNEDVIAAYQRVGRAIKAANA